MIDIVMNFRTTYVKEGEVLITNPWKIAVHYFKTYFVVDFVAAIPWDLLASLNSGTEEVRTDLNIPVYPCTPLHQCADSPHCSLYVPYENCEENSIFDHLKDTYPGVYSFLFITLIFESVAIV